MEPLPVAEPRLGRRTVLTLPLPPPPAEEQIAAIGLEPRNDHSGRHLDPLVAITWPVDLLDAIRGELKQVLVVEGRSCIRGDIDRAQRLPARRIEVSILITRQWSGE